MNNIKALTKKVENMTNKVDSMNARLDHKLRTEQLRKIMRACHQPKACQQVDIVDALRSIANSINPAVLR